MTAPIIVTATFGDADFAWLDHQRRTYFPAERNQLAAHLTLFHALPPSLLDEVKRRLATACAGPLPPATLAAPFNLGRGVAYRIESEELAAVRAALADAFAGCLSPQDAAGFRAHVTVQNKVAPAEARALLDHLRDGFARRPIAISGLACHWYRGGPWEPIAAYRFRGALSLPSFHSP